MQPENPPTAKNTAETELPTVEVKVQAADPATPSASSEEPKEQWRQAVDQVLKFVDTPPDYVTNFFTTYKRPLITVGLILAAFVSVKILFGLLDAINDIPLVAPTLELIGIAYSVWFIYRYLLGASNRQELLDQIQKLKNYIVGS